MLTRRRLLRAGVALVAVLGLAWLLACFLVIQHPTINQVSHADAVIVLGPPDDYRLEAAQRLVAAGVADHLVISVPASGFAQAEQICAHPPSGVTATCFAPNPATTRGEAEEVARLERSQHWKSVVVVTSKFHVSRARMIFDRCVVGQLAVVSAPQSISWRQWIYQYTYQSAGYLRAFLHSSC